MERERDSAPFFGDDGMSELYRRIYEIVRQIPAGEVATYGQIAWMVGNPRLSRVVGYAMHAAPGDVPCHRVVNREGKTAAVFYRNGIDMQRVLLEQEGVPFTPDGRVNLRECGWQPFFSRNDSE